MQQQTNEQLNTLLQVVEEIPNLLVVADERQKINWINKYVTTKTGYTLEDLAGKSLAGFLTDSVAGKQTQKEVADTLKSGDTFRGTLLHYTKNGVRFWNEVTITPVKNEEGKIAKYVFISTDVTDRVYKNQELLYNELRWKFAIEKSGDDYFEYNFENNRFFGSENLQSLLQLNHSSFELDVTKLIGIVHPQDTEKAVNAFFDLTAGSDNTFQEEIRLLKKSGNFVWVNVRATVTERDAKGNALHLIGTTSDISRIKETEQELLKAKARAEEISEYRSRFLATISHEIRTPLNGIIGLTNLMLLENKNKALSENLNTLSFSANHLRALINDVLDLSKIEAGKIDFTNNPFNLHETIEGIYKTFKPLSGEKNIALNSTIDSLVPEFVVGDKYRLTQVLNNLVNNAIKFTEKGKVEMSLSLGAKTGKKATLKFSITDTGIGIEEKHPQIIFEDFMQADAAITAKYGGTGLGLAITKKLIEMQGGELQLQSQLNKGSCFSFTLTYDIAQPQKNNPLHPNQNSATGQNKLEDVRILLAEDNLVNQKVAVSYFNHWQAQSDCAKNGNEALALFQKNSYDLLIVDLYMPEMDGFETITEIRKLKNGKQVPIIALTASAEETTMQKALDCGANICLTKPFDAEPLLNEIKQLLYHRKTAKPVAKKAVKQNETEFKHINLKRLEEASLGSKSFVLEMIETIGQEVPPTLNECKKFLQKRDLAGLASSIHKLKNSLLLIGLDKLEPELKLIENKAREGKLEKEFTPALSKIIRAWNEARKELNTV